VLKVLTLGSNFPPQELTVNVLWLIWDWRNGFVFQQWQPRLELIVDEAALVSNNHNQWLPSEKFRQGKRNALPRQWMLLKLGDWKFNVDCSWIEGEQERSVARVCRDSRGCIIISFALREQALFVLERETLVAKRALLTLREEPEFRLHHNLQVDLLTDSTSIISCLSVVDSIPWVFSHQFEECNAPLAQLRKVTIAHSP